jgi:proline iminopeptidase
MKTLLAFLVSAALSGVYLTGCTILEPDEPGLLVPRTVDEDQGLPSITVNGTRLHAETYGQPGDPMIVVLHGGPGGDYRNMLSCSGFSSDSFFVVFYDQRGSGLSRRHPQEAFTIQVFIDDLDAVIRHYRRTPGQKVILLGKSWGAMLAAAYVNLYPDRVNGLILMEPGGFTWDDAQAFIRRSRSLDPLDENSNDYVYVDQFLTGNDHDMLDYKAALQAAPEYAPGNSLGNAGPVPFWRKGAVCSAAAMSYAREHGFDFTTHLDRFTPAVLFLHGELNRAYGRVYARQVSSAFRTVELVEIRGSGHEIPTFGWDEFSRVARTYLRSVR